jgi:lysophospholipase
MFARDAARPEGGFVSVIGRAVLGAEVRRGAVVAFNDVTELRKARIETRATKRSAPAETRSSSIPRRPPDRPDQVVFVLGLLPGSEGAWMDQITRGWIRREALEIPCRGREMRMVRPLLPAPTMGTGKWLGVLGLGGLLLGSLGGCAPGEADDTESDDAQVVAGDDLVSEVDYAQKSTAQPAKAWSSETSFAKGKDFDPDKYAAAIFEKFGKGAKLVEIPGTPHQEYASQPGIFGKSDSEPVAITLRYAVIEPTGTPRNETIVLVHGMTESSAVYAEVAMDLAAQGYAVYIPNHRGHGFSDRLVDEASMTGPQVENVEQHVHIGEFEDYIKDLDLVVQRAKKERGGKVFGIGHSMGGGILTRYLELHPTELSRAVLVAPMHKINVDAGPLAPIVRGLAKLQGERDDGTRSDLPPRTLPFDASKMTLAKDNGTTSAVRWGAKVFANVEVSKTRKHFTNGGATFGWIREVLVGTQQIRDDAKLIKTPILILQAHNDAYVQASGHEDVCKGTRAAGGSCKILHFGEGKKKEVPGGTKHEILYHGDVVRNVAMDAIYAHLTTR